jgi:Co/Zn/Cd efflux system component
MALSAILAAYFGWPLGAVYSNLLASAICSLWVYLRMRAKVRAAQVASMAQAARHHKEQLDQAAQHHQALIQQAQRHHEQTLDRMDAHHAAMKAHVSTVNGSTRGLTGPLKGKAATDG